MAGSIDSCERWVLWWACSDSDNVTEASNAISSLLRAWGDGDLQARDNLLPLVYLELRRRARSYLRRERPDHTLQPTALVNEAYIKLAGQDRVHWKNRAHFF